MAALPGAMVSPVAPAPAVPRRIPSLDGLRGVALLGVLAYHVAPAAARGGFLGVESFFVLSGFLLASLLVAEQTRDGTVDRRAFLERRVRRIAPALLTLLAAIIVLGPLLAPDDAHRLLGDIVSSLAGVTNWHLIADASSYFDVAGRPPLVRHLWSVAVEIQFYALCPFLVTWLWHRRRDVALAILATGIAASATAMALLYRPDDPSRAYYGTDARVGALLSGVALALVLAARPADPPKETSTRRFGLAWWVGPAALVALVALFALADDRARWAYPGAFLATQALTAGLILAALRSGPPARLLAHPVLRWFGARSFGIYLWHWPVVVLLRPGIDVELSPALAGALGLGLAVVLGALSYRLVERPLLRPRSANLPAPVRARRRTVAATAGVLAVAGLASLLVRLPTADPLAETLRAGQRLLAAQPTPTLAPPTVALGATTTTMVPSTTEPTMSLPSPMLTAPIAVPNLVPVPPTPAPPPSVPITVPPGVTLRAIGDSVMVSAAGALQERLGPSAYIDAALNRQFADGIAVARAVREQGGVDVVVVHLGNNGPVEAEDVDALMGELSGVRAVLFVNVRVDRPWEGSVNQTLADAAGRFPQAELVDWFGASEGHGAWFQSDGTHFRTSSGPGASAFADLIAGSVPPPPTTTTVAPPTTLTPVPPVMTLAPSSTPFASG